jgi:hypothetical protein
MNKNKSEKVQHFTLTNGAKSCTYHVLKNTLVAVEEEERLRWDLTPEARADYQHKLDCGWRRVP